MLQNYAEKIVLLRGKTNRETLRGKNNIDYDMKWRETCCKDQTCYMAVSEMNLKKCEPDFNILDTGI